MNAKNRWLIGLQWGACSWLAYVVWDEARQFYYMSCDAGIMHLFDEWPRFWWSPAYLLLFPGWLAAAVLLVMGSRRARPAVAVMILVRVIVGGVHSYAMQLSDAGAQLVVPLLLPLLPLVVLRVEEPRVVLALAMLGRFREALARSGGVVALLVALAVLSIPLSARDAMWVVPVTEAFRLPAMLVVLAGMVAWATRKRGSAGLASQHLSA